MNEANPVPESVEVPTKRARSPSPPKTQDEASSPARKKVDIGASSTTEESGKAKEKEAEKNKGKGRAAGDKKGSRDKSGRVWEPRPKTEGQDDGEKRLPKKKAAILIGYCGTGYSGMQIQVHGAKTIEGTFFEALIKAGAVSADNSNDHRKVDVQRAARTDAGVHAAGNCISMKMILDPPLPDGHATLTSYVNSFLPEQIRMWGFVRTMKSFQARTACDSRVYEYLLPSYCLLPPASTDYLSKMLNESSPGWRDSLGDAAVFSDASPELPDVEEGEKLDPRARGEYERRRGWRVDEGTLKRFRGLIAQYKGTHNFHNYTVGKPFNDRSVKRFMISLEVKDPVVYGEIEWISVQIHGQSFMLHQIRKMLSLAMLACRTGTPSSLIPETFGNYLHLGSKSQAGTKLATGPKRIHVPKAPPLGLLLESPQFKTYNDRIKETPNDAAEEREPVNFGLYKEEMQAFKVKYIYEKLRLEELESSVFHKWIRQMDCSQNKSLSFLNAQGLIPPEAQIAVNAAKKREQKDLRGDESDEEVDQEQLRRGELEG
ncbi:tRNA pseudouridine38-40 synthase, partial [Tremellales sp. Uapishka_1]